MSHRSNPQRSNAAPAAAVTRLPAQPRWEHRSTKRVLEKRGDEILERSRAIVQAANELLETEGLDGLTIRAVLKQSGLARRAFYERFADKDELMLAVFEEVIRSAARDYTDHFRAIEEPVERLRFIVTTLIMGGSQQPKTERRRRSRRSAAMSREHLRLAESRPQDLQAALSPLIKLIAEELSRGMQAGRVRAGDPEQLASFVFNLVSTTAHTVELVADTRSEHDSKRRAQLASEVWEFCRRAISV